MDEWQNELWYIHPMEYYSPAKGDEVLIHVTLLTKLQTIMFSGVENPTLKRFCIVYFHLYTIIETTKW